MNTLNTRYELRNGVKIPCIGFGTWQSNGPATVVAVKTALDLGYRLVDTAAAYGNEIYVGQAVRESDVDRKDIFITSKLRNAAHGYDATMEAFEMTVDKLDVDYLDLYLIHWPNPIQYRTIWREATAGTWRAFEELYKSGRICAIGVSNFMPHHIEMLMETSEILPMVNQLFLCAGVTQPEAVRYCKDHGILVEAYSPFGTGKIFSVPEVKALSEKYGKSVGQVILRWCLQMGYIPLPKSSNTVRIKENIQVFDFVLNDTDVKMISNLEGRCGVAPDPDQINF